jgi:hypothetical protein
LPIGTYAYPALPTPLYPSANYFLTNDITITSNATFTGANILIAPGVKITVSENVKLVLDACHLFTCPSDNQMWKGIVLASNPSAGISGRIEVRNNTLIEDANIAIAAIDPQIPSLGDYIIKADGAIFNRNGFGIQVKNLTFSTPATYPISVENTVFTARDLSSYTSYPMSWPTAASLKMETSITAATPPLSIESYALANTKLFNIPSYYGIYLENVGYTNAKATYYAEVQIGNGSADSRRNLFDHMSDGIFAYTTNLSSYNNWFARAYPLPPLTPLSSKSPLGYGIHFLVEETPILLPENKCRLKVVGMVSNQPPGTQNRFYDCYKGISMNNCWRAECTNSIIQTSNTSTYTGLKSPMGIYANAGRYEQYDLNNNKIYNVPIGIYTFSTTPGGVAPRSPLLGTVNILNNLITDQPGGYVLNNPAFYVMKGISVGTVLLAKIATSPYAVTINNNYVGNAFNGIDVTNQLAQKVNTTNNNIVLRNFSTGAQYGINYSNSKNGLISGNTISGIDALIPYNNNAKAVYCSYTLGTKICDNTAQHIGRGFEFANTTAQAGTIWTNNTMRNNSKGMVLGSDIGDQFLPTKGMPPTSVLRTCANVWDGTWTGNYQTYVENKIDVMKNRLFVRGSIANEYPKLHGSFPSGNQYYNIGLKISILPFNVSPNACYDFGFFALSVAPLTYAILADSLIADTAHYRQQWLAQLGLYQAGLVDTCLADSSAQFAHFMSAALGTRYAWLSDIEMALGLGNIDLAQSLMDHPVSALGRQIIDSDLVLTDYSDADDIVATMLQYYQVYKHYVQDSLSSSDSVLLAKIAQQCPSQYGPIVYQARVLGDQIGAIDWVYDDDACAASDTSAPLRKIISSEAIQNVRYMLYPNPNKGNFVLEQSCRKDGTYNITIVDVLGKVQEQQTLNFYNAQANMQTHHLLSGYYYVSLDDGIHTQWLKLAIQ